MSRSGAAAGGGDDRACWWWPEFCWSIPPFRRAAGGQRRWRKVDTVQPEQVEHALDAMEVLGEFSRHVRADSPESKL